MASHFGIGFTCRWIYGYIRINMCKVHICMFSGCRNLLKWLLGGRISNVNDSIPYYMIYGLHITICSLSRGKQPRDAFDYITFYMIHACYNIQMYIQVQSIRIWAYLCLGICTYICRAGAAIIISKLRVDCMYRCPNSNMP